MADDAVAGRRALGAACGLMSVAAAAGSAGLLGGGISWLQPACATYGAGVLAAGLTLRSLSRTEALR